MLRVALVCLLADSGGVEHHVASLATGLDQVADVVVVTTEGGWLASELHARDVRVASIPACRGNFDLRALGALRRTLLRERPDVVHSHVGRSDWYAWLASIGQRVLLVSTEHGISADHPELYGGRIARVTHRLAHGARLRRTDVVIAVSNYTARALVSRYAALRRRAPIVVLPGVDLAALVSARHDELLPDGVLRVLCLSRLSYEKGVDILVAAVALAAANGTDVHLTVAGEGPERASLERLAFELGIQERVALPGRVDDVTELFREADVLAIPSRSENLPLAALESLAAGVPVVGADVGGVAEVVIPSVSGWLVPPQDTEALAAVLSDIGDGMALRGIRARLGDQDDCYSVAHAVQGVLRAYEFGNLHG